MYEPDSQQIDTYQDVIFMRLLQTMFTYLKTSNSNGELGVPTSELVRNQGLINELLSIGMREVEACFDNVSVGKEKIWKDAIQIYYGPKTTKRPDIKNSKLEEGNFLGQCIKGTASLSEYQDFYRYWSQRKTIPLGKYLGMTKTEFERFQKVGESGLMDILIDKANKRPKKKA